MSKQTKKKSLNKSSKPTPFSIKPLNAILIVGVFALVGGFLVYSSFAASNPPVCASGSRSQGYRDAYKNGKKYKIRLCRIVGFKSTGDEDNGWVHVSSNASGNWVALFKSAQRAGIKLTANSSFRSYQKQKQLYDCYNRRAKGCNPAAPPGYSNHQSGEAIDIDIVPGPNNDPTLTECLRNYRKYPVYNWLSKNAYKYKRYGRVAKECWHWSPTGY